MKLTLLMLTLASSCHIAEAQAQSKPVVTISSDEYGYSWKPFESKEGRFSVLMPTSPTAVTRSNEAPEGQIVFHSFDVRIDQAFYQVGYTEYRMQLDANQTLDRMRDMSVKRGGELLGERAISLGEFPGREWRVLRGGVAFGIIRVFVVENRTYQMSMLMSLRLAFKNARLSSKREDETELFNSASSHFFDSFKLIKNPAAAQ